MSSIDNTKPKQKIIEGHHFYRTRIGDRIAIVKRERNSLMHLSAVGTKGEFTRVDCDIPEVYVQNTTARIYWDDGSAGVTKDQITHMDLVEVISKEEAYRDDPYVDVPFDDWYVLYMKRTGSLPVLPSSFLPHHGREINLMYKGLKPFAIVGEDQINEKRFKELNFSFGELNDKAFYVTLPGESWRVIAHNSLRMTSEQRKNGDPHRVFGGLLGYREEDIEIYIARQGILKEYYTK